MNAQRKLALAIPREVCAGNLERFMAAVPDGKSFCFMSQPILFSSPEIPCQFVPSSPITYLTGFQAPNAVALVSKQEGEDPQFEFFLEDSSDPIVERYYGKVPSCAAVADLLGAPRVAPIDELPQRFEELDAATTLTIPRFGVGCAELDRLRAAKSDFEIEQIRAACEMTERAMLAAFRAPYDGTPTERDVRAEFECAILRAGAVGPAFPTVCAAGANGNIIHHVFGESPVDSTLLLDCGARSGTNYVADITRTVPGWRDGGRKFTEPERALMHVVADARDAIFAALATATRGGLPVSLADLQMIALQALGARLSLLEVFEGERDQTPTLRELQEFFPCAVAHHVGMDVHDCATLDLATPLPDGSVLAVEPGLYLRSTDAARLKPEFEGLCCRQEDVVALRGDKVDFLSGGVLGLSVRPDDLEQLVAADAE